MPLEQVLRDAEKALDAKQYEKAVDCFSKHIKSNPESFQAYLKRSIAYQRSKQYEKAQQDLAEALKIAEKRGHRSDMGLVHFRLGLVAYSAKEYREAFLCLKRAKTFDCQEPTLDTWITKAEHDVKKIPSTTCNESVGPKSPSEDQKSSTHIDTINKYAPLKTKIKDDWYQSATEVIITIYAKNINKEKFSVEFGPQMVSISFPSEDNSEYNYHLEPLFSKIDELASSFKVFGTKVEVYLAKKDPNVKWPTLELLGSDAVIRPTQSLSSTSATQYPSSLKKAVNWATFTLPDDEEQEKSENDFFAKLYKDTDDDTRRAMMKSYVESNGTVLTTNWEEAKGKTYETSPPEGMEAKKWQK